MKCERRLAYTTGPHQTSKGQRGCTSNVAACNFKVASHKGGGAQHLRGGEMEELQVAVPFVGREVGGDEHV